MRSAALMAFVAGVCALQLQPNLPSPTARAALLATCAVLGLLVVAARGLARGARNAMVLAAAGAAGFALAAAAAVARLADELPAADEGREIIVEGVVSSLPARLERGVRFEFDIERVLTADAVVPSRVLLSWYAPGVVRPAERWQLAVALKRPHGVQNPGGFDLEAWLLERNLRATGAVRTGRHAPAPRRIDAEADAAGPRLQRWRYALRERLAPMLEDRRYGGVILALIVGDQRAIGAADWTLFNRTGIAHLVSISGLHITMIASLAGVGIAGAWRRVPALAVRLPAQIAGVLTGLAAAAAYALLAGWGIPAQRTVLMLAVVGVGWLTGRRIGLGLSLALAAAVVCLADPWAVLAAGFWLSFGAVAAIAWVVHGRTADERTPTWRRVLRSAARVQIAVTLALVPAGIVLFNQLSLISPLANAVAIPVVSWIVTPVALVGSVCAVLPGPSGWLAEGLLALAHDVFAVLAAGLESLSALPAAMRAVATPPWPAIALGVFGIGWALAPPGCPSRRLGLALALPLFVWPAVRPTPGELWLTALDVGQGSAVLLETHDRAWLYDSGPRYSNDSDAGERIVLPYLRYRGIARLDGLIVSHLDADHAGGTAAILRGIDVARVVTSVRSGDPVFLGRAVDRCIDGMHWGDGPLRFQVLHPAAGDYERRRPTNAMSCVVLAAVDERRVLLAGDVSATDEAAVLARWPGLRAEWLAAPHHGSRSSSSAALLATLGARHAVAQAGYRNRYGHPDPTVVARYAQYGVDLARTDRAGALQWRFTADGGVARRAWRSERVRYWHDRAEAASARAEPGDEPFDIVPSEPFIAG